MVDYFKEEKVSERITAIRSRSGEIMYLVEGNSRAVLIDTCVGIKGLRAFVEELTSKPITTLITHGHIDHAMGAPEFDDVYMNPLDKEVYMEHCSLEGRKGYIAANIGGEEPWMQENSNFVPETAPDYKELKDGDVFQLGGISVEAYSLGGHTKGTMVMLIPEEHILITGDACNTATFLFDKHSLTVEAYRKNLLRVDCMLENHFDRCFMMHHVMEASRNLLKNVVKVCDEIMEEQTDDMEFEFMGQTNYVAKRADEKFVRLDGGEGNIIYNKQKVHEE